MTKAETFREAYGNLPAIDLDAYGELLGMKFKVEMLYLFAGWDYEQCGEFQSFKWKRNILRVFISIYVIDGTIQYGHGKNIMEECVPETIEDFIFQYRRAQKLIEDMPELCWSEYAFSRKLDKIVLDKKRHSVEQLSALIHSLPQMN
ncbi:MAG: hypothetical protein V1799_07665 [bacterium]